MQITVSNFDQRSFEVRLHNFCTYAKAVVETKQDLYQYWDEIENTRFHIFLQHLSCYSSIISNLEGWYLRKLI